MRKRLEKFLERLVNFVVNRAYFTIFLSLFIVLALGSNIRNIGFDMTTEGLLLSDDPAIGVYSDFLDRYGRDEKILIAVKTDDIFTPEAIAKITKIHKRIENETPLISRIDSIINARDTRGEGDTLIVGELFDDFPQNSAEWQELKNRALSNTFYVNLLISSDATLAAIVVRTLSRVNMADEADDLDAFGDGGSAATEPLSDEQNSAIVRKIKEIASEEQAEGYEISVVGSPVVTDALKRNLISDVSLMLRLLCAAIAVLLFLFFKRFSSVFYPLLIVVLSLISMLGLIALCGVKVKLPFMVAPTLLLAVGVGACVHLLALYYRTIDTGAALGSADRDERKAAIVAACSHSALPIAMTSLTTMAGVASFVTAKIDPFIMIGFFLPFGIFMSLVFTLTLLPALLVVTPIKRRVLAQKSPAMDRVLIWTARLSWTYPKTIVLVFAALLAVSIAALSNARLSHYLMGWFPQNDPIRAATHTLDDTMRGTVTIEALIDFGEENAIYDPATMKKLERSIAAAEKIAPVGFTIGVPTIIKEINRALNENSDRFYEIPDSRGAIAEEILLFGNSGSDDLNEVTNSDLSQTRITLKVPFIDAIEGYAILDEIAAVFKMEFPNAKVEITGILALMCRALTAAVLSTAASYAAAIFMIAAMMIFMFGWRLGLFAMIPNLTPIIIGMAFMIAADIPFDMFVMLVGSIVLGLAIDDTIHFIHNYRRYFAISNNAEIAIEKTMLSTGRAMMITSVVLSVGFSIYLFAYMRNLVNFGTIAGLCIILALLADFLLTPALLYLWSRRKQWLFSIH